MSTLESTHRSDPTAIAARRIVEIPPGTALRPPGPRLASARGARPRRQRHPARGGAARGGRTAPAHSQRVRRRAGCARLCRLAHVFTGVEAAHQTPRARRGGSTSANEPRRAVLMQWLQQRLMRTGEVSQPVEAVLPRANVDVPAARVDGGDVDRRRPTGRRDRRARGRVRIRRAGREARELRTHVGLEHWHE